MGRPLKSLVMSYDANVNSIRVGTMDKSAAITLSFLVTSLIATFFAASSRGFLRRVAAIYFGGVALLLLITALRVLFGGSGGKEPLFAFIGALLMAWFGHKLWEVAVKDWKSANPETPPSSG